MKTPWLLMGMAAVVLSASSCRKAVEENFQSAEDNSQIETEYAHIFDIVTDVLSTDNRTMKTGDLLLPSGATVTFTDSIYNDGDGVDFTINYGPLDHGAPKRGIVCTDGRYRAGVVNVGIDKRWSDFPCTATIAISAANGYYAGDGSKMYQVTGTKTIQRSGENTFVTTVGDATMKRDNGTIYWSANRTITRTADAGPGWWNDEYTIAGSAEGTNANGANFTVTITSPLVKKLSGDCVQTFIAGSLAIKSDDTETLTVDYDTDGTRQCDRKVKITYNGKTREINLW